MTLPASGPLTFSDIQTEFGGSNPIALGEYYAGGGLVPAGTSGTYGAVPTSGQISVQNFYGTSNYIPVYIEDLFNAFKYTGNGSTQTITNGINFSSKGGLFWSKRASSAANHYLTDTTTGTNKYISTNISNAQDTTTTMVTPTTTGFTLSSNTLFNANGPNNAIWAFAKQPKFFDIVTYTGTGVARTIAHNLGSVPGCIILKRIDNNQGGSNWYVYHRANTTAGTAQSQSLELNSTGGTNTNTAIWNNTAPTSSVFSIGAGGSPAEWNGTSGTYMAYLFAHDAGGFGATGSDNIISCGSFSGNTTVNIGFEPQWILLKRTSGSERWYIIDNVRGWPVAGDANYLAPNNDELEGQTSQIYPNATGFSTLTGGGDFIYVAIRRGPMKVPTVGTSVFLPSTANTGTVINTGFNVDLWIGGSTGGDGGAGAQITMDRLRGANYMGTASTAAAIGTNNVFTGWPSNTFTNTVQGGNRAEWLFGRAPSFCDVVCYTGNDVNGRVLNHNLGVAAEFVIQKKRNGTSSWAATVLSQTNSLILNTNDAQVGVKYTTASDATTFTIRSSFNGSPDTYVAYLFATAAGVSKVGSYTGTGALQTVNCGFTSGSRYIIIKRYDSTGDWYVWDSARGISSGNDPYLLLNSNASQVTNTNYVDTDTTGFKVTAAAPSGLNASGGTYVFLAIA
jgi:hypothetical protein